MDDIRQKKTLVSEWLNDKYVLRASIHFYIDIAVTFIDTFLTIFWKTHFTIKIWNKNNNIPTALFFAVSGEKKTFECCCQETVGTGLKLLSF